MKNILFLLVLSSLLWTACQSEEDKLRKEVTEEVNALESGEVLKSYLTAIFMAERNLDSKGKKLEAKYGDKSTEFLDFIVDRMKVDKRNEHVVADVLTKFGHPTHQEYGHVVSLVPWMVIHKSRDLELKETFFDVISKAYENEDIDSDTFSMFLNKFYTLKTGKAFSMNKGKFSFEEEIEALSAALKE